MSTSKAAVWLDGGDTGESSKNMLAHPRGRALGSVTAYPNDMDDFGRCVRLLKAIPELRTKMRESSYALVQRQAIVRNWDRLEAA